MTRAKILAVVFSVWVLAYPIVAFLTGFQLFHYLPTWVDDRIYLWPPAVYVYILYYPLFVASFLLVKDMRVLKKGFMAFVYAELITCFCFLIYPVVVDRPSLVSVNDSSSWILTKVWAIDTAVNSFPSQHVTFIWVCAFMVSMAYRSRKWVVGSAVLVAILISVSTVLVKQHYVWDVIAGAIVAAVSCFFAFRKKG